MAMMLFEPVVGRAPQGDPRGFWVCEGCRRVTKSAVFFTPGLVICEECFLAAVRAYLADAGTIEALNQAVAQAAEKAAAAAVRQMTKDLGAAVAGAALAAALDALKLGHAEAAEQEK